MNNVSSVSRSKGSYFRPPAKKPYAWLIYLYASLFLGSFVGDIGKILAIFPSLAFIIQIVANTWNLFRYKPKLNLSKIAINIVLFIILGLVWGILKGDRP